MLFNVKLLANLIDSSATGYRQEIRVSINGDHLGSRFSTINNGDASIHCNHLIMTRHVEADSCSEAMRVFDDWMSKGLPESFLLTR